MAICDLLICHIAHVAIKVTLGQLSDYFQMTFGVRNFLILEDENKGHCSGGHGVGVSAFDRGIKGQH